MAEIESVVAMAADKDAPHFKEVKNRKRRKGKDMDTGEDDVTLMETAAKRPSFPPVDDATTLVSTHTHTVLPEEVGHTVIGHVIK